MTADGDPLAAAGAPGSPAAARLCLVRVDWVHHHHQLRRLLMQDDRQLARELGITGWS